MVIDDPFVGTYYTVWIESEGERIESELKIFRNNNNPNLFKLEWRNSNRTVLLFVGSGMMYDGLLVGAYWDA